MKTTHEKGRVIAYFETKLLLADEGFVEFGFFVAVFNLLNVFFFSRAGSEILKTIQ